MLKKKKVSGGNRVEAKETAIISDLMAKKWERKEGVSQERMSKQGRIEMQSKTKGERIQTCL